MNATHTAASNAPFQNPLWLANIEDWLFFRAAYEGGRKYLKTYLDRHAKELDVYYDKRVDRAVYPNATRSVVETFVAHVFHEPVNRPSDASEGILAEFHGDIDLQGNPADAFYSEALSTCLVYGSALAVCDRLEVDGVDAPETAAQEAELGRRPYALLYSPIDLVDWDVDRFGNLRWAMFVETDDDPRAPGSDPTITEARFKLWTRTEWKLFKVGKSGDGKNAKRIFVELDSGTHEVGRVPVAILHFGKRKGRHPVGESAIKDIAPMNRRLANLTSLVDEQAFQHVFNILAVPDSMFEQLGKMNFSTAGAISFPDNATKAPFYLAPDVGQLGILRTEIDATMAEIRVLSGVGRQNEQSLASVSGKSMALQTMDKVALLKMLGARLSRFELAIDEMALAWMGQRPDTIERAEYDDDFDPESLNSALEEALQFESLGIGGLARMENLRALTKTFLGPKLTAEEMAAVDADIVARFTPAPIEDEAGSLATDADPTAALNGIQVRSIVEMTQAVARKDLAAESAIAILQSAFGMDAETATRIIESTAGLDVAPDNAPTAPASSPPEPPTETA